MNKLHVVKNYIDMFSIKNINNMIINSEEPISITIINIKKMDFDIII